MYIHNLHVIIIVTHHTIRLKCLYVVAVTVVVVVLTVNVSKLASAVKTVCPRNMVCARTNHPHCHPPIQMQLLLILETLMQFQLPFYKPHPLCLTNRPCISLQFHPRIYLPFHLSLFYLLLTLFRVILLTVLISSIL